MINVDEDPATAPHVFDPQKSELSGENQEVTFDANDLFFSRTDERGVIQSGNAVFQRVSGYTWSKLIGAPHKLVRHDDMPKAVFHILWKQLQKGLPVVAYVKNRTKDGGYYWVLAFATPIDGGYLSVRVKPQSEFFALIQSEYVALRDQEKSIGLSAEESADALLGRFQGLGFNSYAAFSAAVAAQELTTLRECQALKPNETITRLQDIQDALKDVQKASQNIADACENVDVLPTNLEIQSSRLGSVAAPIGIIARDCNDRTRALLGQMVDFIDLMQKATRSVNAAILRVCVTEVQGQVSKSFETEENTDSQMNYADEASRLSKRNEANKVETMIRLREVVTHVRTCSNSAKNITRVVAGLNVTRTMCNIECSLLGPNAEAIRGIIDQLEAFQNEVPAPLRAISSSFNQMQNELDKLLLGCSA